MTMPSICVVIAAYNAQATVARSVASALTQDDVAEVVVVDDASTDATAATARAADDGSGRLQILQLPVNSGPSAARNMAVAASVSPFLAVLDADDFLLPGRFAPLLGMADCDLAADNIVFVPPERAALLQAADLPEFSVGVEIIDAADFAAGNLARAGVQRGELGFLKPLMSRAFLDRHGLRYDEGLWLGEDYDLYMRMLLKGARFGLTRQVGYGAVVRPGSLSGQHRTADLAALMMASHRHLTSPGITPEARLWIGRHWRATRAKYLLRACLDHKASRGWAGALGFALLPPSRFMPILRGVLRDKLGARRTGTLATAAPRFLIGPS